MPVTSKYQKIKLRKEYLKARKMYKTGDYTIGMIAFRCGRNNKSWAEKCIYGKGFPLLNKMNLPNLSGKDHKKKKKT